MSPKTRLNVSGFPRVCHSCIKRSSLASWFLVYPCIDLLAFSNWLQPLGQEEGSRCACPLPQAESAQPFSPPLRRGRGILTGGVYQGAACLLWASRRAFVTNGFRILCDVSSATVESNLRP